MDGCIILVFTTIIHESEGTIYNGRAIIKRKGGLTYADSDILK